MLKKLNFWSGKASLKNITLTNMSVRLTISSTPRHCTNELRFYFGGASPNCDYLRKKVSVKARKLRHFATTKKKLVNFNILPKKCLARKKCLAATLPPCHIFCTHEGRSDKNEGTVVKTSKDRILPLKLDAYVCGWTFSRAKMCLEKYSFSFSLLSSSFCSLLEAGSFCSLLMEHGGQKDAKGIAKGARRPLMTS